MIYNIFYFLNVRGFSRHVGTSRLGVEQQWLKIACVGWRCFTSTVMILSGR